jgi:hypothetical protein
MALPGARRARSEGPSPPPTMTSRPPLCQARSNSRMTRVETPMPSHSLRISLRSFRALNWEIRTIPRNNPRSLRINPPMLNSNHPPPHIIRLNKDKPLALRHPPTRSRVKSQGWRGQGRRTLFCVSKSTYVCPVERPMVVPMANWFRLDYRPISPSSVQPNIVMCAVPIPNSSSWQSTWSLPTRNALFPLFPHQ